MVRDFDEDDKICKILCQRIRSLCLGLLLHKVTKETTSLDTERITGTLKSVEPLTV